jgi:hypothetical protein
VFFGAGKRYAATRPERNLYLNEDVVTADAVLSRELKSLQDEISASNRERLLQPADSTAAPADQPEDKPREQQVHWELREFVNAITEFFADAEKNVSAYPAASVIGAMSGDARTTT